MGRKFQNRYPSRAQIDNSVLLQFPGITLDGFDLEPVEGESPESQLEPILFCLCVGAESRGEPIEGIKLVAQTIMNRYRVGWNGAYSVRDVIMENRNGVYQFSGMKNSIDNPNYAWMVKPDYISYFKVIKAVLPLYFKETIQGAEHVYNFHATWIEPPWWTRELYKYKTIGQHIFYSREFQTNN